MFLLDSLQLFFLSPFISRTFLEGSLNPWLMLFFSLNALLLLCLIFLYSPRLNGKSHHQWWSVFINSITLSSAFSAMQWGYLIAHSAFVGRSLLVEHFIFSWVLSLVGYSFLWRFVSSAGKINVRIVIGGILLAVILNVQMLLSVSGVNGIALSGFDAWYFYLSLLVTAGFFAVALWIRFSAEHYSSVSGETGIALGSGVFALLAALCNTLTFKYAFSLSWHVERASKHFLSSEVLFQGMLFGIAVITLICLVGQYTLKLLQHLEREKQKNLALSNLNDGIIDAIVAFDPKGRINFYNKAAESLFGWQASEMIGQDILCLASDEHKDFLDIFIKRLARQKMPSVIGMHQEFIVKHKEGQQFPVRIAIGCYGLESDTCFAATIANMQELRVQIRSQKESVREYQSLISNLPCVTFRELHDDEPHWVYLSENAKVLTGLSASELITEMGSAQFMESIFHDDADAYRQIRKKATKELGYYDIKYRYVIGDNQIRWFWEIGYCYRTKDSTVWADGIIVDISHKQEHHQVLVNNDNNQSFVLSPIKKFQFEKRLHNISQLTNALIKFKQTKVTEHYLQLIHNISQELEEFIQSKRLSDIETHVHSEHNEFSLRMLSQKVFSGTREVLQAQSIECQYDYSNELAESYLGDEIVTAQILHNMLNVSFSLIKQGKLALSLCSKNGYVRIVVECFTENKLEKEAKQQLFDPFDNQLIEQVDGYLWFDLHTHGALLYADLPLAASSEKMMKNNVFTSLDSTSLSSSMINVLVVDDVMRNQHELNDIFWRQGVRLTALSSIEMLKNKLDEQSVDLILLDAYIDKEVRLQQIRAWANKKIKIIALTFSLDNADEDIWLRQGFDSVLTKPFNAIAVKNALAPVFAELMKSAAVDQREKKALLFDEYSIRQRWSSFYPLFCLVKSFAANFGSLAEEVAKNELNDELVARCRQAKDAALSLGFLKLQSLLSQIIELIEKKERTQLSHQYSILGACMQKSIDAALASLGMRYEAIKDDVSLLEENKFSKGCEVFVHQLEQGKFDEKHYKKMLPTLANLVPLPELAEFIDSIEAVELKQAYQGFVGLMDKHDILLSGVEK